MVRALPGLIPGDASITIQRSLFREKMYESARRSGPRGRQAAHPGDRRLDGPRAGEVLVEIKATGVCHTDEYTLSGADAEGLFPSILGHEGAGIVVDVGKASQLKQGDHVIPLYTPECRECEYCLAARPTCARPSGYPGQGGDARRQQPVLLRGAPIHHYMGTSTFSNYTVLPEIALAKIREDAPFDKVCYIGCGVTTGIGAVINTAKVQPGDNVVVFGLGGIGLNVVQGARMVGADIIVGVDMNPRRRALAEEFGMTHFVNPQRGPGDLVPLSGRPHRGRCRLQLRVHRQRRGDAPGAGVLPQGWGTSVSSAWPAPGRKYPPARSSSSPAGCGRDGVRRCPGADGRAEIVDWYMEGKIKIDALITHVMPLEDINEGFDLMQAGESIRRVVVY